jgi:RNA polymerase sigma-70 factor (ECF subfamily)
MPEITASLRDDADPQRETLLAEEQARVRAAVAGLPDPYREIISLRFLSSLSIAEISAVTGRPIGTVKAQIHRGLARLRLALARTRP